LSNQGEEAVAVGNGRQIKSARTSQLGNHPTEVPKRTVTESDRLIQALQSRLPESDSVPKSESHHRRDSARVG
jgi:hypothetical protein